MQKLSTPNSVFKPRSQSPIKVSGTAGRLIAEVRAAVGGATQLPHHFLDATLVEHLRTKGERRRNDLHAIRLAMVEGAEDLATRDSLVAATILHSSAGLQKPLQRLHQQAEARDSLAGAIFGRSCVCPTIGEPIAVSQSTIRALTEVRSCCAGGRAVDYAAIDGLLSATGAPVRQAGWKNNLRAVIAELRDMAHTIAMSMLEGKAHIAATYLQGSRELDRYLAKHGRE